jgi:hypothetical protein
MQEDAARCGVHTGALVFIALLGLLMGCGSDGSSATAEATPTPMVRGQYALVGTVNGEAATGRLGIVGRGIGLNVILYDVTVFSMDGLTGGSGSGELSTLTNELTLDITVQAPTGSVIRLGGTGHATLENGGVLQIPSFVLRGGGFSVQFEATLD